MKYRVARIVVKPKKNSFSNFQYIKVFGFEKRGCNQCYFTAYTRSLSYFPYSTLGSYLVLQQYTRIYYYIYYCCAWYQVIHMWPGPGYDPGPPPPCTMQA